MKIPVLIFLCETYNEYFPGQAASLVDLKHLEVSRKTLPKLAKRPLSYRAPLSRTLISLAIISSTLRSTRSIPHNEESSNAKAQPAPRFLYVRCSTSRLSLSRALTFAPQTKLFHQFQRRAPALPPITIKMQICQVVE